MEELHRYVDTATLACSNNINDSDLLQLQNALDEFDPQLVPTSSSPSDFDELIKSQIVTHPRYPELLSAYIDCRKVGAAPEMASLLEEIRREQKDTTTTICNDLGVDSELDEFMDSYCEILQRYKEDLSKPFDEATTFLNNLESQLNNLCSDPLIPKTCDYGTGSSENNSLADEAAVVSSPSSEEESGGENDQASESQESSGGNEGIKVMLLRKYSGHLSNLRKEFMKTRKKGKLPKEAKSTLLNWWNSHYRWPYPTEEEKMKLAETTRLDQKQINNWFINQRKRHWKPSEDIRVAVMEGVRSTTTVSGPAYFDTAEPNYTITYP